MQIHEIQLNTKNVLCCPKSGEVYFLVDEDEEEEFNPGDYDSMSALWTNHALFEPDFKDAALEKDWDDYCTYYEEEMEQEEFGFGRILSFLKEVDRPDLKALDCTLDGRKEFRRCVLVLSEDFIISTLAN
jgi:hypothetical protein